MDRKKLNFAHGRLQKHTVDSEGVLDALLQGKQETGTCTYQMFAAVAMISGQETKVEAILKAVVREVRDEKVMEVLEGKKSQLMRDSTLAWR